MSDLPVELGAHTPHNDDLLWAFEATVLTPVLDNICRQGWTHAGQARQCSGGGGVDVDQLFGWLLNEVEMCGHSAKRSAGQNEQ